MTDVLTDAPFVYHVGDDVEMPEQPTSLVLRPSRPITAVRCKKIKKDGMRCKKWSIRGTTVCLTHGGSLPNVREHANAVVEAARMRLLENSDLAIDTLEALMEPGSAEGIRLKAATEILDRAGIRGGFEVEVAVDVQTSSSDTLAERLTLLRERGIIALERKKAAEDAIDAEIVDDQDTLF